MGGNQTFPWNDTTPLASRRIGVSIRFPECRTLQRGRVMIVSCSSSRCEELKESALFVVDAVVCLHVVDLPGTQRPHVRSAL